MQEDRRDKSKVEKEGVHYEAESQHASRDINQAGRDVFVISNQPLADEQITHTSDLKAAINIWLENFPKAPGSTNSALFFYKVKECEKHPLYSDLSNHLPQSGFDVCGKWEQYKDHVRYLDKLKNDLLTNLQEAISEVFPGIELKFVEFYNPQKAYDYYPPGLKDFECNLPRLIFESLLFELDINNEKVKMAKNREAEEIDLDISRIYDIWNHIENYVKNLHVTEKDNSVVWGKDEYIELIRMPKKYRDVLDQGMQKAVSIYLIGSEDINFIKNNIFNESRSLDKEREELLKELEQSLYCRLFSGVCRYLHADQCRL